jgi:antitoxin component YwqK of YwqJK toxin-antitoxin module
MFTAMKGLIFILLLASFACTGKVHITEDEIMPDIFYAEGSFEPFTGQCNVISRNSNLVLEQFSYKKGVLHGKALAWYKNGKLKRKGFYHNGKLSGAWEFWDEKGNKTMVVNFENDELNGQFTSLGADGRIREKGVYKANQRTGKWTCNEEEVIVRSEIKNQP